MKALLSAHRRTNVFDGRKTNKLCFNNKTYQNSDEIEAASPSPLITNTDQSKEFTAVQDGWQTG